MNQLDLTLLNVAAATVLQTFTDINISYHFKERIFPGFKPNLQNSVQAIIFL